MDILKGKTLLQKVGNELKIVIADEVLKSVEVIGFYFSAHWCNPCKLFTPQLVSCYKELKSLLKPFEVVFVSRDVDESSMKQYMYQFHGDWLAVEFGDDLIDELTDKYDVGRIPALIIVRGNGDIITYDGQDDIRDKGYQSFEAWTESKRNIFELVEKLKDTLKEHEEETETKKEESKEESKIRIKSETSAEKKVTKDVEVPEGRPNLVSGKVKGEKVTRDLPSTSQHADITVNIGRPSVARKFDIEPIIEEDVGKESIKKDNAKKEAGRKDERKKAAEELSPKERKFIKARNTESLIGEILDEVPHIKPIKKEPQLRQNDIKKTRELALDEIRLKSIDVQKNGTVADSKQPKGELGSTKESDKTKMVKTCDQNRKFTETNSPVSNRNEKTQNQVEKKTLLESSPKMEKENTVPAQAQPVPNRIPVKKTVASPDHKPPALKHLIPEVKPLTPRTTSLEGNPPLTTKTIVPESKLAKINDQETKPPKTKGLESKIPKLNGLETKTPRMNGQETTVSKINSPDSKIPTLKSNNPTTPRTPKSNGPDIGPAPTTAVTKSSKGNDAASPPSVVTKTPKINESPPNATAKAPKTNDTVSPPNAGTKIPKANGSNGPTHSNKSPPLKTNTGSPVQSNVANKIPVKKGEIQPPAKATVHQEGSPNHGSPRTPGSAQLGHNVVDRKLAEAGKLITQKRLEAEAKRNQPTIVDLNQSPPTSKTEISKRSAKPPKVQTAK